MKGNANCTPACLHLSASYHKTNKEKLCYSYSIHLNKRDHQGAFNKKCVLFYLHLCFNNGITNHQMLIFGNIPRLDFTHCL